MSDPANPTPPTPPAPPTPNPPTPPPPTPPAALAGLTPEQQAEVTRIATREKDEGRRAAEKAIFDGLGVTSADELKAIKEAAERQRASDKAAMTEAERKLAEANETAAKAQQDAALAARTLREATVKSLLVGATVRSDRLDDAALLVSNSLAADADPAVTAAAVESFKASHAEWFGPAAPAGGAPSGLPGGGAPRATPDKSGLARGAEIAKQVFKLPDSQTA